MHILQGGVPKCGNFWLYQIIQQILVRTGHNPTSFIQKQPIYALAQEWDLNYPSQASIDVLEITDLQYSYRISSIYRRPIENLAEYVAQTHHVWTHSPVCKKSEEVFELFDKKIYIIRDPRDRALSAAKYYTSAYMLKYYPQPEKDAGGYLNANLKQLLHEWVWHVFDHLRLSQPYQIHLVHYENLLNNFKEELNRLLQYLGLDLTQTEKEEITQAVSFNTLKKHNPQHLQKGTAGYWQNHFTPQQSELTDIMAGPLLKYLNYTPGENQARNKLGEPDHQNFEQLKEEILASQARLY